MLTRSRATALVSLLALLTSAVSAQSLTGRVVDAAGQGIAGVTLLFSNGGPSTFTTNATGSFTVTGLTNRTYNTVDFRGPNNAWAAVQLQSVRVQGATTLPNVVLSPGALVSGTFVGPNGPIVGGNMNAYDLHGNKIFTPNDATLAGGAFSIVVPLGAHVIRAVPPVGSGLIPIDRTVTITAPLNLGTLTSRVGYSVTGIAVDAINGVPIPGIEVRAFDGLTGAQIAQIAPTTNAFGTFSLQLPFGFYELQLYPPAGNAHAPRQVFGLVVTGNRAYGQVPMERAVFVSGTVTGPAGLVATADIDVITPSGYKLWTPNDNTNANGTFSLALPPGNYHFVAQPPQGSGLAAAKTGLLTISALGGSIGNIAVQPGMTLVLQATGPNGPLANANLDFFDPATGADVPLVGDHANALGIISATVPTGFYDVRLDGGQGSNAQPLLFRNVPIVFPAFVPLQLPAKQALIDVRGIGVQATGTNGAVPLQVTLANLQPTVCPVLVEVSVRYSDGTEAPVLPPFAIDLPPGLNLTSAGNYLPVGAVPTTEKGKLLRYTVRLRSPATSAVLDEGYAEFVVY